MFTKACNTKRENLKRGVVTHWLYDALIFKKLKQYVAMLPTDAITAFRFDV